MLARYVHLRPALIEIANCSEHIANIRIRTAMREPSFLPSFLPGQTQTHIVRVPLLLPRCSISSLNRTHLHARLSLLPLVILVFYVLFDILLENIKAASSFEWFLFYFEQILMDLFFWEL